MNTKPSPALPVHSSTLVFLLKCGASSSHLRAKSMTLLHRYIGRSTQNLPAVQVDVRDAGAIPESGRYPWRGHGNPLHYSCLENPMNRGAGRATVHGVTRSWTRLKQLSTHMHTQYRYKQGPRVQSHFLKQGKHAVGMEWFHLTGIMPLCLERCRERA